VLHLYIGNYPQILEGIGEQAKKCGAVGSRKHTLGFLSLGLHPKNQQKGSKEATIGGQVKSQPQHSGNKAETRKLPLSTGRAGNE
jgi:hypothetical protein